MAFACQPTPLTGEPLEAAVSAALGGASIRRLAREHGLSRADAAGLARWAAPLSELYLGLSGGVAGGEIELRHGRNQGGPWPTAAPQKKTHSAQPAHDEEKNAEQLPAPPAPTSEVDPPTVDTFEDVPADYRTPELAKIYRDAFNQAMGARS